MATNVLICDDSSFARKQMARAIPKEWEVDIHFAGDGVEGVQAIREGKGEVVFLDLTMPNLDGYGVLETIRKEDLPAMVIVVSGDIQPDAQDRVKKLGAMAFIKKPIDAEKAREVLTEYGILTGA
ncbi:response regulator [Thalassolituus pacificus]|uniref:Response regulator n=1 Tax=Thalassolituus pacificus TaxID=2975440 RepID=A0A9X3AR27_9GAMM|nr:response regulator [Thalassolituus pacificus]MCT7358700.1 response regulator [Thalassolituus pacificus]